jgi:WD40 repeat protein
MIIFCKTCFIHHNSRNKIKHKGSNVENYLTEDKINSKCNKFQIYINDIEDVIEAMKNDILKDINISEKNGNDIQKIKINFQEKYLIHKSINEELKLLLELILKNSEYFKSDLILNRKFLFDMIINTSINKKYPRLDKSKTIIEQMNYFLNFLKYNYISLKQEYFLKLLNKYENSSSKIEKMISLQDNKFIIINKDCEIQIYKINKDKNHPPEMLYSFNEHANNITCIILLKNKKNFATASDDSTIRIWDVEKGACIKTIITEGKPYLIFEKYGKDNQIGCVPNRNSLSIYEYGDKIQNTVFKISLEKSLPWIEGLYQFSNDGRIIISSFGIFDLYSSDLEKIKRIYIANMAAQNFLQITNEDLVVGFGSKDIFIYDKNINFKKKLLGHHNNVSSILQLNNNKLLTASLDSNIILWNIDNYEMIFNFMNNHLSINSMILINENRILTYSFFNLNIIEEWEIENSENIIK